MKVKLEWLNDLVDISDLSVDEIVNILSLYSIEVENVENVVSGNNLVVGHVLTKFPHPDSDHLSICSVDVKEEVLQIVCGAPNVEKDQYVIVAKNGAQLPNGLKIKKSKIRGVESNGMICSLQELGLEKKYILEEYQNGIYYFKDKIEVGSEAIKALNFHDAVIELGLTPNRGDLLSMIGVAIEISAVLDRPMKKLTYDLIRSNEKSTDYVEVINQSNDCIGYYAQVIKNVEIKQSPWWLISRLIAFGIRPINNVVDITNYILALFGQPLHAFDYEKLGSKILVRNAYESEKMITLDGLERNLIKDDLVITNGKLPVAIAGVMGGQDTEITNKTRTIVIEAAVFNPNTVRQTSQRLGLRSDSSTRFEKGVDINRTKQALDYTCYLLNTLGNAVVLKDPSFSGIAEVKPIEVKIDKNEVCDLLGIELSKESIKDILERLKFEVNNQLIVKVPNRRNDIKIEVDLIEEIGRIHGYENLPTTLPSTSLAGSLTNVQKVRRNIKNILTNLGLNENVTYSLISEKDKDIFSYNQPSGESIELLMPLSLERKYLRKNLVMGLIENAKYCYSRKIKDLAIFEIGKVYYKNDKYHEEEYLSILMSNQYSHTMWKGNTEKVDFYLIKGVLETLFNKLKLELTYKPIDKVCEELHPKRSASVFLNNENIGFIGCIHPKFAASNDLDEIYLCEIKLSSILNARIETIKYQEVSKVPSMERDIAIVVDRNVLVGEIIESIREVDQKVLSDIKVFDVYIGDKVDSNKKSIAIKLVFSALETLTDDFINSKMQKILKILFSKYNATLRT